MNRLNSLKKTLRRGFTLLEALMGVAVLSTLTAVAVLTISNLTKATEKSKLKQDVVVINNAIQTYLVNGGTFLASDLANPEKILAKLKKRASANSTMEIAGMRGSLLDARLIYELQSTDEAEAGSERARFISDPKNPHFEIQTAGPPGIRKFVLSASQGNPDPGTEDRTASLKLAKADPWVWDYKDSSVNKTAKQDPPTLATVTASIPAEDPDGRLLPPQLSIVPATYNLADYPMTLGLTNPNPPGSSRILVSINGASWTPNSSPITILPTDAVVAFAETLNSQAYQDSDVTLGQYFAKKVTLLVADSFPNSMRYTDLGGPMASGTILLPGTPSKLLLTNGDQLPDYWENHDVFQMFWTQDGTSPTVAGPGVRAGNNSFAVTYPGDKVPLGLMDFPAPTLTLKYYAKSKNDTAVIDSSVASKVIARTRITLLPPTITPGSRSLYGDIPVAMIVDTTGGQTPASTRIFYRTDGTDPGDVNGEPAAGAVEYVGTFLPTPDLGPVVTIVARTYPPAGYKDWFTTSAPASVRYFLPYGDKNIYAVQRLSNTIYAIDAVAGTSTIVDSTAPMVPYAIALDGPGALLYYVEAAASGWRLGRFDVLAGSHTILGPLGSGNAYNCTLQPENLAFFNGNIFYMNRKTDDLVKITVSGNSITSITKVADINKNPKTFDTVGDLAVDESGWMYFSDDKEDYYRFDLNTMSGLKKLGDTERANDALAMYQARLYAADIGSDQIRRVAPSAGDTLSKITTVPSRKYVDFAAPSPLTPVITGKSIWAIVDKADGPHLHEIRNYRNPVTASDIDYGILYAINGNNQEQMIDHGDSYINNMCISNTGMLYFVRNFEIKIAGKDYIRPVMRLNLASLVLGDALNCTFCGDLKTGLTAIAGNIDPDDIVSGLTLGPSGQLYGILREGAPTGTGSEDYLFRITEPAATMTGPNLTVTLIGRTISTAANSSNTEDLAFAPNGILYASDQQSGKILRLDPNNASPLSVLSTESGSDYRALAVDPSDYRLITCSYSGATAHTLMQVAGGSGNDTELINLDTLFGHQEVEAIGFFQGAWVKTNGVADLYASDGTETIYGVDFDTGSTTPFTDAPYQVKALGFDFTTRRLYYLENNALSMNVGSCDVDTGTHTAQGSLLNAVYLYNPTELPDNLCYFGGFLWYVPPHSDDLVKVAVDGSGFITGQTKAADLTANTMQFDLTGDLAVDESNGWMYFTTIRFDGQRFCRFRIRTMSSFEVLAGPTLPSGGVSSDASFQETWFDALAFRTQDASNARPLYGTYASAPSPLRIVSPVEGASTLDKPTIPPVRIIDFSDYHPGALGSVTARPRPVLAFSNLRPAYTYADVGGTFLTGLNAPPAPAPLPNIVLANPNEVPLSLQKDNTMLVKWTHNGTNPKTASSGVTTGPGFTDGMPDMPVSVAFAKWTSATLSLRAMAVSQKTTQIDDSPLLSADVPILKTQLRDAVIGEITNSSGQRQIIITPSVDSGDCPPGTRIYYTTNETDPGLAIDGTGLEIPVTGTLYTGPFDVPASIPFGQGYIVTARVYPPPTLGMWFSASSPEYYDVPLGLAGGHMDVDTSHLLYPFRCGHTDFHVHEYDKRYNVVGASFFNFQNVKLENIPVRVPNGQRFKILVVNADLSPGGRLVINKSYNSLDSSTYIPVKSYDNTPPSALPIYTLDGIAGTTKLTDLGLYFDPMAIAAGGLHGTVTGWVKQNNPGKYNEYRNGALTIQIVKVNADGSPAFTTNTSYSNGGVQGVATSGLLWETTFFWHHPGGPYR